MNATEPIEWPADWGVPDVAPTFTGTGPVDVYDCTTGALYLGAEVQACATAEDALRRVRAVGPRREQIPVFLGRRLVWIVGGSMIVRPHRAGGAA